MPLPLPLLLLLMALDYMAAISNYFSLVAMTRVFLKPMLLGTYNAEQILAVQAQTLMPRILGLRFKHFQLELFLPPLPLFPLPIWPLWEEDFWPRLLPPWAATSMFPECCALLPLWLPAPPLLPI